MRFIIVLQSTVNTCLQFHNLYQFTKKHSRVSRQLIYGALVFINPITFDRKILHVSYKEMAAIGYKQGQ